MTVELSHLATAGLVVIALLLFTLVWRFEKHASQAHQDALRHYAEHLSPLPAVDGQCAPGALPTIVKQVEYHQPRGRMEYRIYGDESINGVEYDIDGAGIPLRVGAQFTCTVKSIERKCVES